MHGVTARLLSLKLAVRTGKAGVTIVKLPVNDRELKLSGPARMSNSTLPILRLLGGVDLHRPDGSVIELPTRKSRLLLAYLALTSGHAHSREKLAGLLWGETQDQQARGSLRNALTSLREALGSEAIQADRDTIMLVPDRLIIDVDQLALGAASPAASEAEISQLYRGELLDGVSVSSQELQDWLTFERTRCRNLAQQAYERAIERVHRHGHAPDAITLAQSLLKLDPLREQSHRILMRAFSACGERSKALEQYHRLKDLLKRELGVEPSAQTAELAREMLAAPAQSIAHTWTAGRTEHDRSGVELASPAGAAPPGPISIMILPFASLSEGRDDHLTALGFTEDLITELSRSRELFVIARLSSDKFSAAAHTAAAAAGEVGVRYAVAGTFRRSADRLRVTAQLIDSTGDRCLWAERYDRPASDTFAIQDEIITQIAGTLDAQIRVAERERAAHLTGERIGAWELAHRGLWHLYRFAAADMAAAEQWLAKAIEISPSFALPHAGLAYAEFVKASWGFTPDIPSAFAAGIRHGERALELDPSSAFANKALGRLYLLSGMQSQALNHLMRAIQLNPSFAHAYMGLAQLQLWTGQAEHALPNLERAQRLSPKDPLLGMIEVWRSYCHFSLRDFDAAAEAARRAIQIQPSEKWGRLALAAALAELGRPKEARQAIDAVLAVYPQLSISALTPYTQHAAAPVRDALFSALRAAGLT